MKKYTKNENEIELIEKTIPLKKIRLSHCADNDDDDDEDDDNVAYKEDVDEYTIEEAISLTGHGKFQLYIMIVTGISAFEIIVEGGCMATVLPIAKCELGISTVEQGLLNSITFIGILIASQIWGLTTDIWGRQKTLKMALLISFISSSLSSLSLTSWMLLISRFIVGLSTSGVKLASCAYLGEFLSQKYRSKYFGILVSCTTFGQFIQSTIALSILPLDFEYNLWFGLVFKPWRLYILIGSLISGLAYIGMLFLPEGPPFLLIANKHEDCLKTLQTMYSINTGLSKETYSVRKIVSEHNNNYYQPNQSISSTFNKKIGHLNLMWNQIWPIFSSKHLLNMLMLCLIGSIGFGISQTFQIWYPQILVYYTNYKNMSLTMCEAVDLGHSVSHVVLNVTTTVTTSTITPNLLINSTIPNCNIPIKVMAYQIGLFNGLFCCVSGILASFVIEKIGKKIILISWILIGSLAAALLIWLNEFYINNLLISIIISSLCSTNIVIFIGCDLFPTKYKGMAMSLVLMISRLGSVVGINLATQVLFNHCIGFLSYNSILQLFSIIAYFYVFWKLDKMNCNKESEKGFIKNDSKHDANDDDDDVKDEIDGDTDVRTNQTKILLKNENKIN